MSSHPESSPTETTPTPPASSPAMSAHKPIDGATGAAPFKSSSSVPVLQWTDICYDIPLSKKAKKAALAQTDNDESEKGPVAGPKGGKPGSRRILENISGHVMAGEMIAVLGASGAGKTTLLNILSARVSKTGDISGSVNFKGKPRDPATWKRSIAYVEQDDKFYGLLTVEETLDFAAKLRLPSSAYSKEEKRQRVVDTLDMLRLEKARDTRIGDERSRGVSGGERKRTSIGQELVSNPTLLLLDEPTSGLDSYAAFNVMDNLRTVARERDLAVLSTIHQPSLQIFNLFDRVVLLARGSIFYDGSPTDAPAYFEQLGYPAPPGVNPADHYIQLAENHERTDEGERRIIHLLESWQQRTASRESPKIKDVEQSSNSDASDDSIYANWPLTWIDEVRILSWRFLLQLKRDPLLIGATFGQTMFLCIIIGFTFFRMGSSQDDVLSRNGALFIVPVNASFSVLFPIISVFPLSRSIMKRERAAGTFRTSSFLVAKVLVEVPSQLAQRVLFYVIVYWMFGFAEDARKFFIWVGVNFVQIFSAIGLGVAIGAVSETVELANILAPAINVLFLLFAGNLIPRPPPWFVWIRWISPLTHTYSALAVNEFSGRTFECLPSDSQCYRTGEDLLQAYNLRRFTIAESVGFLFAISSVLFLLSYFGLRFTAGPRFRYK